MKKQKKERWVAPVYIAIVMFILITTCVRNGYGQEPRADRCDTSIDIPFKE